MAKAAAPDRELASIAQERERISTAQAALKQRERNAREAIAQHGRDLLTEAFSKGDYKTVTKADAKRLSKHVEELGLPAVLERLGSPPAS